MASQIAKRGIATTAKTLSSGGAAGHHGETRISDEIDCIIFYFREARNLLGKSRFRWSLWIDGDVYRAEVILSVIGSVQKGTGSFNWKICFCCCQINRLLGKANASWDVDILSDLEQFVLALVNFKSLFFLLLTPGNWDQISPEDLTRILQESQFLEAPSIGRFRGLP